jgi:hypothetical protein
MFVVVLRWHKSVSWHLGESHAILGGAYGCPWWINEAHYALAYHSAKLAESSGPKTVRVKLTSRNISRSLEKKGE